MAGAGAVRSTAHDLTVFLEACLGRRETPSQPALRQLLERRQELRGVAGGAHQRPTRQHPHHPDRRYAIAPGAGSQPASTVLRPRLGNVDDHDVIVVIVERTAHFAASLEGRKKITVIGDHTEQTNRSLQSSTRCPRRIERPYRRYLAPRGAGRALHQAIKRTWAAAAAPRVIGGPR